MRARRCLKASSPIKVGIEFTCIVRRNGLFIITFDVTVKYDCRQCLRFSSIFMKSSTRNRASSINGNIINLTTRLRGARNRRLSL